MTIFLCDEESIFILLLFVVITVMEYDETEKVRSLHSCFCTQSVKFEYKLVYKNIYSRLNNMCNVTEYLKI